MVKKYSISFSEELKNRWWNHYITSKVYWTHGVTLQRLEKIKSIVFKDNFFWSDILLRHGGSNYKPEELKKRDSDIYDHLMGNMSGMIHEILFKKGLVK